LPAADLPFIDEHSVDVGASPDRTWEALCEVVPASFRGPATQLFARLVGTSETRPRGLPCEEVSAIVGFTVGRVDPPTVLALEGEHRFSRYALVFRIGPLAPERSRLLAQTRAEFPRARGRVYRAAVIGTRAHVVVVRRLLHAIRARAEQPLA
jgi:hypothetical protein